MQHVADRHAYAFGALLTFCDLVRNISQTDRAAQDDFEGPNMIYEVLFVSLATVSSETRHRELNKARSSSCALHITSGWIRVKLCKEFEIDILHG